MKELLRDYKEKVEGALDRYLPPEDESPGVLHEAMRYSVFSGGKRFRPILSILSFNWGGGNELEKVLPAAAGIELIHTYSLIHDDLPSMDDDDLRRNKPTAHKKYGEGIAILSGDALHALAFELLARCNNVQITKEVAHQIGTYGLVGGQVADLKAEGRDIPFEELEYIHTHKTAALIKTSLIVGARIARVGESLLESISDFGYYLGYAFQIVDDILDVKGATEELGKKVGSDEEKGKATFPKLMGMESSYEKAEVLINKAKESLPDDKAPDNEIFYDIANFVLERSY